MNELPIYIIDDDPAVLALLDRTLASQGAIVRTYPSANDFIEVCVLPEAACLILDLRMPGMTGLGLMDWLREHHIEIPVIILSGHGDIPAVVDSMKRGAIDFIEKPVNPELLVEKVHALMHISQDRIVARAKKQQMRDRFANLTDREKELLELLAEGLSSKQIAAKLNISIKTVENHRSHLLAKTHAVNVASLIRMRAVVSENSSV